MPGALAEYRAKPEAVPPGQNSVNLSRQIFQFKFIQARTRAVPPIGPGPPPDDNPTPVDRPGPDQTHSRGLRNASVISASGVPCGSRHVTVSIRPGPGRALLPGPPKKEPAMGPGTRAAEAAVPAIYDRSMTGPAGPCARIRASCGPQRRPDYPSPWAGGVSTNRIMMDQTASEVIVIFFNLKVINLLTGANRCDRYNMVSINT